MKKLFIAPLFFVLCFPSFAVHIAKNNDLAIFLMHALEYESQQNYTKVRKEFHGPMAKWTLKNGRGLNNANGVISCTYHPAGFQTECHIDVEREFGGNNISSVLMDALKQGYDTKNPQIGRAIHKDGYMFVGTYSGSTILCYRQHYGPQRHTPMPPWQQGGGPIMPEVSLPAFIIKCELNL